MTLGSALAFSIALSNSFRDTLSKFGAPDPKVIVKRMLVRNSMSALCPNRQCPQSVFGFHGCWAVAQTARRHKIKTERVMRTYLEQTRRIIALSFRPISSQGSGPHFS